MRWSATLILAALAVAGCGDKGGKPEIKGSDTKAKAPASAAGASIASKVPDLALKAKKVNALELAKGVKSKTGKQLINLGKDAKAVADGLKKGGPGLTKEQFEALLLGLAKCEVKDNGIDRKCAEYKAYREGRKNRGTLVKDWGGMLAGMGRKHIGNASPAVRVQAARLMGSIFGTSAESQTAIVEAAKKEQHPQVLKSMLRAVASSIKKNDGVRQLMLANAAHANAKVRMEVVGAITSSWAAGTEGTLEKAMEMVEKDKDAQVRQYACRRLGERADERALPLLLKLTGDAKTDPKLYSTCVRGLIAMWSAPVPHKNPSKAAYDATIKLFKKTPRTKEHPPWTAISAVEWSSKKRFQEAAKWFKPAELIGVLMDITKDRKANWLARTGAVDALKRLGATPAQFEALKKSYADAAGKASTDKHVLEKIEKALGAGAKKK